MTITVIKHSTLWHLSDEDHQKDNNYDWLEDHDDDKVCIYYLVQVQRKLETIYHFLPTVNQAESLKARERKNTDNYYVTEIFKINETTYTWMMKDFGCKCNK
jgi:hypothetical protein